jgi:hypothetical protein
MPSIDIRPRTLECGASALPAPDEFNPNMQFPPTESDVELQTVLSHLPEGWLYVRAYRAVPNPDVEDLADALQAQLDTIQEQATAQGVADDEVALVTGPIEAQMPEEAFVFERVSVVISPAQITRLTELGLVFDDLQDDDDFDLDLDDGDELPEVTLG